MGRPSITGELRECAARLRRGDADCGLIDALERIADEIDREHARRMDQQAHDLRNAFCRYIGGVVDDYRHGIKRTGTRKGNAELRKSLRGMVIGTWAELCTERVSAQCRECSMRGESDDDCVPAKAMELLGIDMYGEETKYD
jgi:hypothetical protein